MLIKDFQKAEAEQEQAKNERFAVLKYFLCVLL